MSGMRLPPVRTAYLAESNAICSPVAYGTSQPTTMVASARTDYGGHSLLLDGTSASQKAYGTSLPTTRVASARTDYCGHSLLLDGTSASQKAYGSTMSTTRGTSARTDYGGLSLNFEDPDTRQKDFPSHPPQHSVHYWMDTPYARYIESLVREKIARERDQEMQDLRNSLGQEMRRHEQTRTELSECQEQLRQTCIDKASLEQTVINLRMRLLKTGELSRFITATGLLKDVLSAWHNFTLRSELEEARKPRPKPDLKAYQQELERARIHGEQQLLQVWNALHKQMVASAHRHMDLDNYQDGKPPPLPPSASGQYD